MLSCPLFFAAVEGEKKFAGTGAPHYPATHSLTTTALNVACARSVVCRLLLASSARQTPAYPPSRLGFSAAPPISCGGFWLARRERLADRMAAGIRAPPGANVSTARVSQHRCGRHQRWHHRTTNTSRAPTAATSTTTCWKRQGNHALPRRNIQRVLAWMIWFTQAGV